jgi:single-strand DNA-binding protein
MKFESGFTKREFVVSTEEMYPQDVKFELLKDKCSILDQYQVGDTVRVSFNIRGSLWQNKYFTNLQVSPPHTHSEPSRAHPPLRTLP